MALKLTQLASKPQLIKITIDHKDLVEKYGDELEFYVMDRQSIDQFVKMATMGADNYGDMIKMVNEMVLDEDGNRVVEEGTALPNDVMVAVIGTVVERLGK